MSSLKEVWVSKASASQRAGRAGRVRAGTCWRLYTKDFHDGRMAKHALPEMLRTSLEELVLSILLLELGQPADFLAKGGPSLSCTWAPLIIIYMADPMAKVTIRPSHAMRPACLRHSPISLYTISSSHHSCPLTTHGLLPLIRYIIIIIIIY
jgi:hypothetical protein